MSQASKLKTAFIKTAVTTNVVLLTAFISAPALPLIGMNIGHADSTGSYVTLSSFSGHPDALITVSGGSFAPNEIIQLVATQNGSQVATASTTANQFGEFATKLQLPVKLAQGATTIKATGLKSGLSSSNSYYVAPFTPSLTAGASQTTPYSQLTVSGSGYAPNEDVDLNLAGAITKAHADADGAFTNASLTTPAVPAASYTLIGAGEASGASAVAYEYINAFYPSASPSSYYVMPATSLGFTGSGFAASEKVTVTDATTGATVSSFTTAADGSFTNAGSFTVPATYSGLTKKFVLTGSLSHASTTTSTVIGQYYPNVSPTVYYVMPGSSLAFNGNGFIPNEVVDVYSQGIKIATATADAKGNLKAAAPVATTSAQAGTSQSYTLTGESSQGSGTVTVQVGNYNPQASPSGYYVMPGSSITFDGSGYAPNEVVNVLSGLNTVASFSTDALGAFQAAGTVNISYSQANSSASYSLIGVVSKQAINFTIGVGQLNAQITPSSYYVLPYAPFSVAATGFAPNETVTLMNGTTKLATTTTNALGKGTFTNVSLPYTGLSSATLKVTGTTSAAVATASVGIGNYNATVVADNYYAKPGTVLNLTGTGFAPNEAVTITAGQTTQTVTADVMGGLNAKVTLPFGQTTKSLDIVSTGAMSHASSTTTITLAPYLPQVSPSTYYAQPGTAISFTGSSFVPNESVSVSLNGAVIGTETADAKGNLKSTGNYVLPFSKTANYTVTGLTSGGSVTMNIGLAQFYAGLQLSSYYGNGGSVVTASGSGYAPNEQVTLSASTAPQTGAVIATVTADAKGNFSKAITIPYVAPGKVSIGAYGERSQASPETSYTVAQVYNSVGLGSYAVPAGKAVTITGSGFFAGEPVKVTSDRGGISYSFKADAQGNLHDSGLVLPATLKEGPLTLTIDGTYSFTSHDITFYVQDKNVQ